VHGCQIWPQSFGITQYVLKQGDRIGVRFIKYDMQGVFLGCAEVLPTRLFDNLEDWEQLKKIVAQKINVILFFDGIF
jgi:hypothetical protein